MMTDAELLAAYFTQVNKFDFTAASDSATIVVGLRAVAAAAWDECSKARRYGLKNNPYRTAENALILRKETP